MSHGKIQKFLDFIMELITLPPSLPRAGYSVSNPLHQFIWISMEENLTIRTEFSRIYFFRGKCVKGSGFHVPKKLASSRNRTRDLLVEHMKTNEKGQSRCQGTYSGIILFIRNVQK